MQPNLNMVIDQVGKDKNIDRKTEHKPVSKKCRVISAEVITHMDDENDYLPMIGCDEEDKHARKEEGVRKDGFSTYQSFISCDQCEKPKVVCETFVRKQQGKKGRRACVRCHDWKRKCSFNFMLRIAKADEEKLTKPRGKKGKGKEIRNASGSTNKPAKREVTTEAEDDELEWCAGQYS